MHELHAKLRNLLSRRGIGPERIADVFRQNDVDDEGGLSHEELANFCERSAAPHPALSPAAHLLLCCWRYRGAALGRLNWHRRIAAGAVTAAKRCQH